MRRIDALTSLRGFAALWVVLFHLQVLPTPVRGRLGQVIAHGRWNVPTWSVSAEWFAYAVLLVPMLVWLRRVATPWLCAGLCTLLALAGLSCPVLHIRWTEQDTLGIVRILPEFLAGYILLRLLHGRTLRHSDALAGTGAALLLLTLD